MNTVYDIGDEVLVPFKVTEITIYEDGDIVYVLKSKPTDNSPIDKIYRKEDKIYGALF